jgi:hypothetical protein
LKAVELPLLVCSELWITSFRNCLPFYWMDCMKIWIVWNKSLTLKWRTRMVGQMRKSHMSVGKIIWLGMIHWLLMNARWVLIYTSSFRSHITRIPVDLPLISWYPHALLSVLPISINLVIYIYQFLSFGFH